MDKSRKNCYLPLEYTLITCPNTQASRVWPLKFKKRFIFVRNYKIIKLIRDLKKNSGKKVNKVGQKLEVSRLSAF